MYSCYQQFHIFFQLPHYFIFSKQILTLTSIFPTFAVDLMIGRPTKEGNMCAGKLEPAYPHFTN